MTRDSTSSASRPSKSRPPSLGYDGASFDAAPGAAPAGGGGVLSIYKQAVAVKCRGQAPAAGASLGGLVP